MENQASELTVPHVSDEVKWKLFELCNNTDIRPQAISIYSILISTKSIFFVTICQAMQMQD